MQKRQFLKLATAGSLGAALPISVLRAAPVVENDDEAFWTSVRERFVLTPDYINLENGYFLFQPQSTLEAFVGNVRRINLEASRYMRTTQGDDKMAARRRLAELAGCSPDELIITRNTTESLDTVISGFDWRTGDEAVMAPTDYGAMLDHFRLMARRYGIVPKMVTVPLDPQSDDEIVRLYEAAITPRTRLLMCCHMINITGQILPVAKIVEMAHRHNVPVMVDGAHAFAQLDFRIPDLGCDYYGSSLHKWLSTPLGAGILYVKRERIAGLWPMFAENAAVPDTDIRKLNHTGTHPVHTDLSITTAIDFHQSIGIARKEARMRYLQQYWTTQVRSHPRIYFNTPRDPARCCAIANVGVQGMEPRVPAQRLLNEHRIWTVAINNAGVRGVRVTPHLYTSLADLDALVRALKAIAA